MVAAGVAYGLIAFSTLLSPSVRGLRRAQHETTEIDTRSTSSG
jgi:hypothetical protein